MNKSDKRIGKRILRNFDDLVNVVGETHAIFHAKAGKTINICTTLRNWGIGAYIQEYEQNGEDRAKYGAKLLVKLSGSLKKRGVPGCSERSLQLYRQFYQTYPGIPQSLIAEFETLSATSKASSISQSLLAKSNQDHDAVKGLDTEILIKNLSFTHFTELLKIQDPLKRVFYEMECIKCGWKVRELGRQIGSLYYERMGLSKNKKKLLELVRSQKLPAQPSDIIRDPYIFEFLGLKPSDVMLENDLRDALVMRLQDFILELGKGFCFEARNKRILIGKEYYFIDLVFYHKYLHANILLELKLRKFKHGDMSQLNTYLNYYRKHEMAEGDKPPIGILLCTEKDHSLVEYALTGIDNQLFVSEYSLQLPTKEEFQNFLDKELKQERTLLAGESHKKTK